MKPIILPSRNTTEGVKFIQDYRYANGHEVPLYDISTTGALNQIIGHAKFVNSYYSIMPERQDLLMLLIIIGSLYGWVYRTL